jgi:signal transduction histidine kinase
MAWDTALLQPSKQRSGFRPGLRRRVALTFLLFGLLFFLVQTVAVAILTEQQEESFIDQILDDEMQRILGQNEGSGKTQTAPLPSLRGFVVRAPNDRLQLPAEMRALVPGTYEIFIKDKEYHVQMRRSGNTEFYLVYDSGRHDQRLIQFRWFLLLGVVMAGMIAYALAFWLSGFLLRQVTELAERVADIDPAQTTPRLSGAHQDAEVALLARAFDLYAARVSELIEREKTFTADVSHELRTPLTVIKTSCELLEADPAVQGKSRERLAQVILGIARMEQTVEALLFIARDVSSNNKEVVRLADLVQQTVALLSAVYEDKALTLDIHIPPDTQLSVNRTALQIVLDNLLRNAYAHTVQGTIAVHYRDHRLSVIDTGAGIPPQDLRHIFDRRFRSSEAKAPGSGLGLDIVKRIVERCAWEIEVESQLGRGTTFRLVFPASADISTMG